MARDIWPHMWFTRQVCTKICVSLWRKRHPCAKIARDTDQVLRSQLLTCMTNMGVRYGSSSYETNMKKPQHFKYYHYNRKVVAYPERVSGFSCACTHHIIKKTLLESNSGGRYRLRTGSTNVCMYNKSGDEIWCKRLV